jgi:Tol biopolymer transport system component
MQDGATRQLCPNWITGYGRWAPDGNAVLFFGQKKSDPNWAGWMLASVAGGEPSKFQLPEIVGGIGAWKKTRDGREWIIFGSSSRDTHNLYRVAVANGKITGKPEQLTFPTGINTYADLSEDGNLVYQAVGAYDSQIWVVTADTNRAQAHGQPEQITNSEGVSNTGPSVSRDGRWLVYAATYPILGESSLD